VSVLADAKVPVVIWKMGQRLLVVERPILRKVGLIVSFTPADYGFSTHYINP
jgi:hypothetical protein